MAQLTTSPQPEGVIRAAEWLADRTGDNFGPVIGVIKNRFDISAAEAARACTLANKIRAFRRINA